MGRLTTFIIGMVVIMVFITAGMGVFLGEANKKYNISGYDPSKIDRYNQLNNISSTSESIKESSMNISSESGITDVLGGFFEAGYDTLRIAVGSFNLFSSLGESALNDTGIADPTGTLRKGIFTIIIIALFLGVIVAAIVKRVL